MSRPGSRSPSRRPASAHPLRPAARPGPWEWALVFPLAALLASAAGMPAPWVFVLSALGILPLSRLISRATHELAGHLGSYSGGLLNITMANAAEFIIALLAIRHGLVEVVKASIAGSIVGNILLGLGLALLAGGLKFRDQRFDTRTTGLTSTLLLLGVMAIVVPSALYLLPGAVPSPVLDARVSQLSLMVAALLLALYVLSMLFSLKTHSHLFEHAPAPRRRPRGALWRPAAVLLASTLLVAAVSELFIVGVRDVGASWGLGPLFLGAILIALVGNASEYMAAAAAALRNNLELSITMTVGSSIQMALFVAPLLVFASALIGPPITLAFGLIEILALGASVLVVNEISSDGQTSWFEGALLCVTYLILAGLFFFA